MKYATIGTSWITQSYIKAANYTGLWELDAVFSRQETSAKEFAAKFGVEKYYTDLTALAADKDVVAVYIASPNALHYEQSKQMLLAGKHVICEKPATVTKEEYLELKALADEKDLVYMEAIMSLHVPAFKTLQENLQKIGKIANANFRFCQLSSKYPALKQGAVPNIFNPALCTGALMDLGVYNLYLIAALYGEPKAIISSSHFLHTGADDTTSAILQYDHFLVTLICSKIAQGYAPSEIVGDEGTITIESISQLTGMQLHDPVHDTTTELIESVVDRTEIMSHEARSFYQLIADGKDNKTYEQLHKTATLVRSLCDTIRKQNNFTF